MSNVIKFPGETVLEIDPDAVLEAPKGKLETALVLGWDFNDQPYFAGSTADLGEVLILLEIFKKQVVDSFFEKDTQ